MVTVDGEHLTLEGVEAVADGAPAELSAGARLRVARSSAAVDEIVQGQRPVYGVSTGVGELRTVAISAGQTAALQRNILRSHAAGVGRPLPERMVRAMMVLRANALACGYSGVRPVVVEMLLRMIASGVHPIVPEQGSLGASGDLAPLAHLALVLMGEGEAIYQGARMPGGAAMGRAGLEPLVPRAKEGLALINGTQFMSALGTLFLLEAERLAALADVAAALSLEALRGTDHPFAARLHAARPHPGQIESARHMRALLAGSARIVRDEYERVQDAYSVRCVPQVHGAVRHALAHLRDVLSIEINSATDNPLVFPDEGLVVSGGNFHGEPLALTLDYAATAVAELASISERRIERLVNPYLSGLPAFLTADGGQSSGYMLAQYTAAALVSENKVLAHPASVDSIPTSANQEDHVSMGAHAARKALTVLENSQQVLAIELVTACQGVDFGAGVLGAGTQAAYREIRAAVPHLDADRVLSRDFEAACDLVRTGRVLRAVSPVVSAIEMTGRTSS
jgi:histidine ammonia-lyase